MGFSKPKRAVNWWLEKSEEYNRWSSGSGRLYCDETAQITWKRLQELIRDENNFVFNAFLYLEPVQRSENIVKIRGPGSCNNRATKSILDVLKAI